jgi:zinc protease
MRAAFICVAAFATVLGGSVHAMENPLPTLAVEQYTLSNGLTVFLLEDHSLPLVAVNVNYMVGSKDEKRGHTGFAHLFEHMMFQGSEHHDDDYFKPLQDVGASVNGGTNTDRTRYWELLPAAYLERALWLESDRMGFLLGAMTQERLDNQISVVQNELRQNYEDRPYGMVWGRMVAVLYPPNHPYSWLTIGSIADLQASSLEEVKDFFRNYYTPNNASLCIAGDFDPGNVKTLVEKYFAAIPPGPPVSRLEHWVPGLSGPESIDVEDRVQLPRSYVAWPTAPIYAADDAAMDVFMQVLGAGKTSRLYKKLVYELQIAQDANAFNQSAQLAGVARMTLTPRPGHTLEEVEKAAFAVLDQALAEGITPKELSRTQTSITAEFVRGMQSIGGFGGLSDQVNEYYDYLGKPDMFRWDLQRYLDLTPASVTATARRYLGTARLTAHVRPFGRLTAATSPTATAVDRSAMPGPGPQSKFHLPARQRFSLTNGLEVVLVEEHDVPLVYFATVLRGGTAIDPAGCEGLASLTAALVQEGAGGRTALEIADELEALGAEVRVETSKDSVVAGLSALKPRMEEALQLYADVLARPDFPPAELERVRKRRLVQLTQLADQPRYVAQIAVQRAIFGDQPYGRPELGTASGIAAISLTDVKQLWAKIATPANATLIVVGDVDREELDRSLAGNLATWRGGPAPDVEIPAPTERTTRSVYVVDTPGAAQSVIVVGEVGARCDTPDYAALQALNTALGGQFVSRLNLNLREDKGYTYGARSHFEFDAVPGPFTAAAPVETAVTVPALEQMLYEVTAIATDRPLTQKELDYVVGAIDNGYPRSFETPAQIARELAPVELYRLPADTLETYPEKIRALTTEQVAAAARKYIRPGALSIVIVGDASKFLAGLEKLDLGPVVKLDREGNRIKE